VNNLHSDYMTYMTLSTSTLLKLKKSQDVDFISLSLFPLSLTLNPGTSSISISKSLSLSLSLSLSRSFPPTLPYSSFLSHSISLTLNPLNALNTTPPHPLGPSFSPLPPSILTLRVWSPSEAQGGTGTSSNSNSPQTSGNRSRLPMASLTSCCWGGWRGTNRSAPRSSCGL
jgi:hypothetical protein